MEAESEGLECLAEGFKVIAWESSMAHEEENSRISTDWKGGLMQYGGKIWRDNKCPFSRPSCNPARTEHKTGIKIQFRCYSGDSGFPYQMLEPVL